MRLVLPIQIFKNHKLFWLTCSVQFSSESTKAIYILCNFYELEKKQCDENCVSRFFLLAENGGGEQSVPRSSDLAHTERKRDEMDF